MSCFVAGTFAKVPVMGNKIRLTDNWEFLRQDVGNIWELVRPIKKGQPEEQPIWTKVTLPHCFNAEDAVDPDLNYYQGPGWYKTRLKLDNPYPDGRMVLEFEGAGQTDPCKAVKYQPSPAFVCNTFGRRRRAFILWKCDPSIRGQIPDKYGALPYHDNQTVRSG